MKRNEIKDCAVCGLGLMHNQIPMFYRINVAAMMLDLRAIQRLGGMEQMMGGGQQGAVLADVLGLGEDLAKIITKSDPQLVCHSCMLNPKTAMAALLIGDG